MTFVELTTEREREDAFEILKELVPQLDRAAFLEAHRHEFYRPHKLFGLKHSGRLVSVAEAWVLMTGLLEKLLWIHAFVTTEPMRSKGFGRELLKNIEAYAHQESFQEIRVHTHREQAVRFWQEGCGFTAFSRVLKKPVPGP